MDVRPGYKQTELGVIPEKWGVDPLGASCELITKGTTPTSIRREFTKSGISFLKAESISEFGRTIPEKVAHIDAFTHTLMKRSQLKCNDLLVSIAGVLGRIGFVDESVLPANTNQALAIVRLGRNSRFEHSFLFYLLRSACIVRQIDDINVQAAQANISLQDVREFLLPAPPVAEQRAIATALSDVDALLDGLDQLIAKKRDLKQATMQQLLTGQTRLPGFSGPWEHVSLNEVVVRATGFWGANNKDERNSRVAAIIRAGDISPKGQLTATAKRYLSAAEFERAKCQLDDLVITTSGNGLGKLWWCDGRPDVAASNFVRVLRPIAELTVGRFLYYALRTSEGTRQLAEHTATSAYPNLRPTYFSTAWIPLPEPPEQTAIAAVLSDMDAELAALEARRDKTHALKQGMMQELLTGKTRLVPTGAARA